MPGNAPAEFCFLETNLGDDVMPPKSSQAYRQDNLYQKIFWI